MGDKDLIVRGVEASLRHPQEFSYHMYNVRRSSGAGVFLWWVFFFS
jgi:hypothetical protein